MSAITRRSVLTGSAALAAITVAPLEAKTVAQRNAAGGVRVNLVVNGKVQSLTLDPRVTLLDALREHLHLTGSKKGCDHGQCGACTVHLDGRRVLACLTLAAAVGPRPVRTIEGLAAADGTLHPMQQAFIDHDGFQCGYCTPGQIMSAVACVQEGHAKTDADIQEYMSGNLCRCAAYPNIVAAIRQGRDQMEST
ncbi:MAG TPA: (2Fe-2S)-binding protein [Steroidobacteraceae bacterium]|nr:(2Fe-2S)-binding protein [Steroidobacteraceae bacterium]